MSVSQLIDEHFSSGIPCIQNKSKSYNVVLSQNQTSNSKVGVGFKFNFVRINMLFILINHCFPALTSLHSFICSANLSSLTICHVNLARIYIGFDARNGTRAKLYFTPSANINKSYNWHQPILYINIWLINRCTCFLTKLKKKKKW